VFLSAPAAIRKLAPTGAAVPAAVVPLGGCARAVLVWGGVSRGNTYHRFRDFLQHEVNRVCNRLAHVHERVLTQISAS